MVDADFDAVIISEEELRERYRLPGSTVEKVLPRLDQHARTFIENARFVLVGTASPDGSDA